MKKALMVIGTLAVFLSPVTVLADVDQDLAPVLSLVVEKRYVEAREALGRVLEDHPDHPRVQLLDGVLRAHEGRTGEALGIFERLRRAHPHMSEPWNNLAVLYAGEGRLDEAREALLAALEREPSATGYANLGDVHTRLANRAYARSRELDSDGGAGPGSGGEAGRVLPLPPVAAPAAVAAGVPAPELENAAPLPPSQPGEAPGSCLRTAGFEDRQVLAGAGRWLRSQGVSGITERGVERQVIRTRQVYLPPFADRAEATAKLGEFRARGLVDVAIIGRGKLANGISFGVYAVTKNVHRRVAALEKLGLPVQVRANTKTVREYVIEARTDGDPDALRTAWMERFPKHSLDPVDCG